MIIRRIGNLMATIWQHLPGDIGLALASERGNPWPPSKNAAARGAASVHELETPAGANTSHRTGLTRGRALRLLPEPQSSVATPTDYSSARSDKSVSGSPGRRLAAM